MKNGAPYERIDAITGRVIKTSMHHCLTPRCRGLVNKKKHKTNKCSRCKWKRFKENNPLKYSFGNLRRRAKQRKKEFALTFEQYRDFAIKTDYARLKGKTSLSLSIDRIDDSRGYIAENIQAISLRENSRKQFVPFFAKQIENESYEPSAEEIAAVSEQMDG